MTRRDLEHAAADWCSAVFSALVVVVLTSAAVIVFAALTGG